MIKTDKYVGLCRQIVMDNIDLGRYMVFLFGSRTRIHHRKFSDIDIGLLGDGAVPAEVIENIREAIDNSIIPYQVDIVDFRRVSPDFRKIALQDIDIWNQPEKHISIN